MGGSKHKESAARTKPTLHFHGPVPLDENNLKLLREERRLTAIGYAQLGFHVVRLHGVTLSNTRLVCDCSDGNKCATPGKHPSHKTGFLYRDRPSAEQVPRVCSLLSRSRNLMGSLRVSERTQQRLSHAL